MHTELHAIDKSFIVHLVYQSPNILNCNAHVITVSQNNLRITHSANSGAGAGHDYGSSLQGRSLGQERDDLGDVEDHFTVLLLVSPFPLVSDEGHCTYRVFESCITEPL